MKLFRLGLLIVSFIYLGSCSYLPEEQIVSDVLGVYETRDYIEIIPNSAKFSKTGFVFYPGGLVDPHSYIEPLSRFAVSGVGHYIVIVKMPGNLAVLDKNQGAYMFQDFPQLKRWVIAGHSLGGVMACEAIKNYPDYFEGLVLMAAYPKDSTTLSGWEGSALSLVGENDLILDPGIIESSASFLPDNTVFYTIPGGNHSYFGKYGLQDGDGEASISREKQVEEMVKEIQKLYDENDWD